MRKFYVLQFDYFIFSTLNSVKTALRWPNTDFAHVFTDAISKNKHSDTPFDHLVFPYLTIQQLGMRSHTPQYNEIPV